MHEDLTEELRRTLRETSTLPEAMQQLVTTTAGAFPVTGAGIMLADDSHILRSLAASDDHGAHLERVQEQVGNGPCVQALIQDTVITTDDVTRDARWPELHDDLRETRVRAVLGMPVHVGGAVVGSLDVYRDVAHEWRPEEIQGVAACAGLAEQLLLTAFRADRHERTVEQLEYALAHRVMIERAVGMLMERHRIDAVEAFERLRRAARESRRRAAVIAEELLSAVSG